MISVHTPNFIVGLVSGITAVTFIALGVVFSIVFGTMGLVFLAVGVIDAIVAIVVFTRARSGGARDEAARISHGSARVVDAKHSSRRTTPRTSCPWADHGSRVGPVAWLPT